MKGFTFYEISAFHGVRTNFTAVWSRSIKIIGLRNRADKHSFIILKQAKRKKNSATSKKKNKKPTILSRKTSVVIWWLF